MAVERFVVFLLLVGLSSGFLARNYKRTASAGANFAIRTVKSQLHANSVSGEVEAEVEVSSHQEYDVRWYMQVPSAAGQEDVTGQPGGYFVPVSTTLGHDVYTQRYWSSGKAYLDTTIMFHPVPYSTQLKLMLEVAYKGYGPVLWYHFQPPVSYGYHPQTQIQHPDLMEVVSYPGSLVNFQPGTVVELRYEVKSKHEVTVQVSQGEVSEDPTELMDEDDISIDPLAGEDLEVSHRPLDGNWTLTTVTLRLNGLLASDKRLYQVSFLGPNVVMSIRTPVLPAGQASIFEGTNMQMHLQSCDPSSKVKDDLDHARFEFKEDIPNCVYCSVSHTDPVSVSLYDQQQFPVGGGPSHAIYFTNSLPDVIKMDFIIYGRPYQSYSFDGNYTCSAVCVTDGTSVDRVFEIITV